MKFGIRKPSIKRSISARTTGRLKRAVKKAVIPFYGQKGSGLVKNPKKAIYNRVYNKTTVGVREIVHTTSSNVGGNNIAYTKKETNKKRAQVTDLNKHKQPIATYKWARISVIVSGCCLIGVSTQYTDVAFLLIPLAVGLFVLADKYRKIASLKMLNKTNLPAFSEVYVDYNYKKWEWCYKEDYVEIQLIKDDISNFNVNQKVDLLIYSGEKIAEDDPYIMVAINGEIIGHINKEPYYSIFQERSHTDVIAKGQFSFLSKDAVYIRLIFYRLINES